MANITSNLQFTPILQKTIPSRQRIPNYNHTSLIDRFYTPTPINCLTYQVCHTNTQLHLHLDHFTITLHFLHHWPTQSPCSYTPYREQISKLSLLHAMNWTSSTSNNLPNYYKKRLPSPPKNWIKTQTIITWINECAKQTCVAPLDLSLTPQTKCQGGFLSHNYKNNGKNNSLYTAL